MIKFIKSTVDCNKELAEELEMEASEFIANHADKGQDSMEYRSLLLRAEFHRCVAGLFSCFIGEKK